MQSDFDYPRDFKGVWIPAAIYLDDRLAPAEKILLAEIDSLAGGNGCHASNKYLAGFCKMSLATLKRAIAHLAELRLISPDGFRGRCRVWRTWLKVSQVPGSERAKYQAQCEPQSNTMRNIGEKKESTEAVGESALSVQLFKRLSDAFASVNPDIDFKREGMFLAKLRAMAFKREDPEGWLRRVLNTAWSLRKDPKEKLFYQRPFLPSYLCSRGIWPHLVAKIVGKEKRKLTAGDMACIGELFGRRG